MDKIEYLLSLVVTILSFLAACFTLLLKLIKAVKEKKEMFSKEQLLKLLPTYMEEAEHFSALTGEEKKQYVIDSIKNFAENNKIAFDLNTISDSIEELVALTKQLNTTQIKQKTKKGEK
jgi:hypothetical protein